MLCLNLKEKEKNEDHGMLFTLEVQRKKYSITFLTKYLTIQVYPNVFAYLFVCI